MEVNLPVSNRLADFQRQVLEFGKKGNQPGKFLIIKLMTSEQFEKMYLQVLENRKKWWPAILPREIKDDIRINQLDSINSKLDQPQENTPNCELESVSSIPDPCQEKAPSRELKAVAPSHEQSQIISPTTVTTDENVFRRHGKLFEIHFGGEVGNMNPLKGCQIIYSLFLSPDKKISIYELQGLSEPPPEEVGSDSDSSDFSPNKRGKHKIIKADEESIKCLNKIRDHVLNWENELKELLEDCGIEDRDFKAVEEKQNNIMKGKNYIRLYVRNYDHFMAKKQDPVIIEQAYKSKYSKIYDSIRNSIKYAVKCMRQVGVSLSKFADYIDSHIEYIGDGYYMYRPDANSPLFVLY